MPTFIACHDADGARVVLNAEAITLIDVRASAVTVRFTTGQLVELTATANGAEDGEALAALIVDRAADTPARRDLGKLVAAAGTVTTKANELGITGPAARPFLDALVALAEAAQLAKRYAIDPTPTPQRVTD